MAEINYDQAAQLARVAGFHFFETCNCGGNLQHHWRKGEFNLQLMPRRMMFIMKERDKNGKALYTGNFDQLENYLNGFA